MLPVKRILCPTDFSGPACTCVKVANELALHFDAELLLVNIVPVIPTAPPDPNYVFKVPEYERYLHMDAEKHLAEVQRDLIDPKVRVRSLVGHGSAADEIVATAQQEQAGHAWIDWVGTAGVWIGCGASSAARESAGAYGAAERSDELDVRVTLYVDPPLSTEFPLSQDARKDGAPSY